MVFESPPSLPPKKIFLRPRYYRTSGMAIVKAVSYVVQTINPKRSCRIIQARVASLQRCVHCPRLISYRGIVIPFACRRSRCGCAGRE
jgi:hypothetical protein